MSYFVKENSKDGGKDPYTLKIIFLVLVYSTAEYCPIALLNNLHVKKIDMQLNSVMWLINGMLKLFLILEERRC